MKQFIDFYLGDIYIYTCCTWKWYPEKETPMASSGLNFHFYTPPEYHCRNRSSSTAVCTVSCLFHCFFFFFFYFPYLFFPISPLFIFFYRIPSLSHLGKFDLLRKRDYAQVNLLFSSYRFQLRILTCCSKQSTCVCVCVRCRTYSINWE